MFDLILGLRQAVEDGSQVEEEITRSRIFLGPFGFWSYVMGMGMSTHGFTHV